jgi:hemerythrin-like metal-binding protein
MTLLAWREQYSVGIATVDREHQALIGIINQLFDAWIANGPRPCVDGFFDDLFNLIYAHFAYEEQLMSGRNYFALASHKRDHDALIDEIRGLFATAMQNDDFESEAFAARLETWFARHFRAHDAPLYLALGAGNTEH